MTRIIRINYFSRNGRDMVAISCANGQTYFITMKQFTSAGLNPKMKLAYIGWMFEANFYQKGEILLNGTVVTDDNKILKDFSCTPSQAAMNAMFTAEMLLEESKGAVALKSSSSLEAGNDTEDVEHEVVNEDAPVEAGVEAEQPF